jgi:hypothetical protein
MDETKQPALPVLDLCLAASTQIAGMGQAAVGMDSFIVRSLL